MYPVGSNWKNLSQSWKCKTVLDVWPINNHPLGDSEVALFGFAGLTSMSTEEITGARIWLFAFSELSIKQGLIITPQQKKKISQLNSAHWKCVYKKPAP